MSAGATPAPVRDEVPASRNAPLWRRAIPYAGTVAIFALIFWRIPVAKVGEALSQAPVLKFFAIFMPFSLFFFAIDSFCLTWVVNQFNAPMRFRDIIPIRASMYLLALINTNLGQGGVAYYLHRKGGISFLGALSSILFIALLEVYQLFLFSTLGVIFYTPASAAQNEIVAVLRVAYVIAWVLLAAIVIFFGAARRSDRIRNWIETGRAGALLASFMKARPWDYVTVLAIKAPSFLASVVAQYYALALYGISVPFVKLMLFLPLVFLAAALPISVAHLGTSQAAWLLFFSGNAPDVKILAYSLAAHFTFMLCNGLIGLVFLPRASRELTALRAADAESLTGV
ncbi:MAG TPA: lysylphosphatidylglycerol synthase domain-containing protein [Candidatus Acidoferrales bacterium]|nr:lysylphosphatidylglycerol synthase domain-containing protein [Candidatus Acidoferrales bacterium]